MNNHDLFAREGFVSCETIDHFATNTTGCYVKDVVLESQGQQATRTRMYLEGYHSGSFDRKTKFFKASIQTNIGEMFAKVEICRIPAIDIESSIVELQNKLSHCAVALLK
ncbi:hypothetical protein [Vibrio owensii]|uniref:hypothetical protein n=1 Tax=Vibrio harveyi group TaxID=717610 RepID=UPI003CC648C5